MNNPKKIPLPGFKKSEVPYMLRHIPKDKNKSILIVGERKGGIEGISESILAKGYNNVTTTDILSSPKDSWLKTNTNWKHITEDFTKFNGETKYDCIVSISVFEHFGFWFAGNQMFSGDHESYIVKWNHDILGIIKSSNLLKDKESKVIITLPAGPFLNYEEDGYPFLRYYDYRRQNIIQNKLQEINCSITNEQFYHTEDYENFVQMDPSINNPQYYGMYNSHTQNVGWYFTIQNNKI